MLYSVTQPLSRGKMTQERKKLRNNVAARRLGVSPAYLSQINKPGGILERSGVTVMRYPEYSDVIEYYEDEILAWWRARHPEWEDPGDAA
jgi:hypothetical protein